MPSSPVFSSDADGDSFDDKFSLIGLTYDDVLLLPDASDLVGRVVSVRLPIGVSMDMTLTGEVRNSKEGPDGIVRIGLEFEDVSDTERSIVDLLERDTLHWKKPDNPN